MDSKYEEGLKKAFKEKRFADARELIAEAAIEGMMKGAIDDEDRKSLEFLMRSTVLMQKNLPVGAENPEQHKKSSAIIAQAERQAMVLSDILSGSEFSDEEGDYEADPS